MPKCGGIAANGKFLLRDSDSEATVSPTAFFQDLCIHRHSPPAFDSSIPLLTVLTAEPPVRQEGSQTEHWEEHSNQNL